MTSQRLARTRFLKAARGTAVAVALLLFSLATREETP
jgi:hypothetical protein